MLLKVKVSKYDIKWKHSGEPFLTTEKEIYEYL